MQVLPLFDGIASVVYEAIEHGAEYADDLLDYSDDPWYWSHSARFAIRNQLRPALAEAERWAMQPRVPNSGVHLLIDNVHTVRLVKSLDQNVPHPGRNLQRRIAWSNGELELTHGSDALPIMSLIMDWHMSSGEPALYVSLPKGPWNYGKATDVHWRHQLARSGASIDTLRFQGDDGGDPLIIDIGEAPTGTQ